MKARLEGVDLAAAVARVVGKDAKRGEELWPGYGPHSLYAKSVPAGSWLEWRPDLGGAAAWEVEDWVAAQERVISVSFFQHTDGDVQGCMYQIDVELGDTVTGFAPSRATALCRAVVARGATET